MHDRPVESKFEMVRPYYSAMRALNILGHAHLTPRPLGARYPSSRMLLHSNCFLGRFKAVVDSIVAVMLESEALLYASSPP